MAELQKLTCPNCGGKMEKAAARGTTITCDYCGAAFKALEREGGGITITASGGSVIVGGPVVSGNMYVIHAAGWFADQLGQVEQAIDQRPDNLQTDKARLKEAVRKIWLNAGKKKEGDWDEVMHELNYLTREANDIFEKAAGILTDPRSEVKDFIEPIVTVVRKSIDSRPVLETVQSFAQAMAGEQAVGNADVFTAPLAAASSVAAKARRPLWQWMLIAAGVGCCVLVVLPGACVLLSSALVWVRQ